MMLTLKFGRRVIPVANLEAASTVYGIHRDRSTSGASRFPAGFITDTDGKVVARVSYNGNVWEPGEWKPGAVPLFRPKA